MVGLKIPGVRALDHFIKKGVLPQDPVEVKLSAEDEIAPIDIVGKPTATQAQYDDLVHYFKYASTAYAIILPGPSLIPVRPNGQKLCAKMYHMLTDTHGYVARDDTRKEIVVAFRGSVTPMNFVTDAMGLMVDWDASHVIAPAETKVHMGFQKAWRTVSDKTLAAVTLELAANPGYSIVVTGHSLGGALASIAGVTLQMTFPTAEVRYYTYGQPRVGNEAFANWIHTLIGPHRLFRVVHASDGVPTMAPRTIGFAHHGTEYWCHSPHSPAQTRICNAAGLAEDPAGSMKGISTGINPAHLMYFGIFYMTPYLF
ncbi:unnamed protein product [Mycena citricolor]|uniref:Fungal lipase-type domain-containing protein n=1 Tax=Mycena citricolor TaxID=2018698 RepID=A0AAD2HMX0_9AGAR|nr:unnamed protein product [Mycena citricolor]